MIEAIEDEIALIASISPGERAWRGRIPTLDISDSRPALWRRALRRAKLPIAAKPRKLGTSALRKAIGSPRTDKVLVQYLDFAVRFTDVLSTTTKPIFVHCHGHDATWSMRLHHPLRQACFDSDYTRHVLGLCEKITVIANSQTCAKRLTDLGVSPHRIIVKYLGVPVRSSAPVPREHKTPLSILYLGRLVDCKGPDLVIRAFESACEGGLDAVLTIAGDGPLRLTCELMRERSAFRDRIRMLGAVDEVTGEKLRAEADIFTAHNCFGPIALQEEAFGVSIVEAMGAGLPVITGRSGSMTEIITHGVNGILVEPGNTEAHAQALLELGNDVERRYQMGKAGWREAKSRFSMERERAELRKILGICGEGEETAQCPTTRTTVSLS